MMADYQIACAFCGRSNPIPLLTDSSAVCWHCDGALHSAPRVAPRVLLPRHAFSAACACPHCLAESKRSHRWRVGRKLGRTLYRDGTCVGMVDTPELAAAIVAAMNGGA